MTARASGGDNGRQSEASDILDLYFGERSPVMQSHEPLPPPKVDVVFHGFDYGLHQTPAPSVPQRTASLAQVNTDAGAERNNPATLAAPSPRIDRPGRTLKQGYRLFPIIQEVAQPPRQPAVFIGDVSIAHDIAPTSEMIQAQAQAHTQPDYAYRPRKESLPSSIRSRADGGNLRSFQRDGNAGNLIPLRILSSGASASRSRTVSVSTTTMNTYSSPPSASYSNSRWSDDTIVSSTVASTPGPRTSFGSLLRRDSMQHPECFFEDYDESAPLSRRLQVAWKRATDGSEVRRPKGAIDQQDTAGRKLARIMLCGCGGRS